MTRPRARQAELDALHEIAGAILESHDLQGVLDRILDVALAAGRFDLGHIRLLSRDGALLETAALRGYRHPERVVTAKSTRDRTTGELTLRVMTARGPRVAEDVRAAPGLKTFKAEGVRSAVVVPVQAREEVVGVLALGSRTPRRFPPALIRLLEAIGRQLGLAVQTARLHEETHRRYQELRALQEIAQAILDSDDLQGVLDRILEHALTAGGFDLGHVRLLDPASGELEPRALRGYRDPARLQRKPATGHLLQRVMADRSAWVVEDVSGIEGLKTFKAEGVQAAVIVPVQARGRVLGTLSLGSRTPRRFPPALIRLLEAIGSQLGLAVQKARLHEETHRAHTERAAAEEARGRLAAVLEATPDLVAIADAAGRQIYMNRAGRLLLGYGEADDLSGTTMLDRRPEWARQLLETEGIPAARREGSWSGETAFLTRDGREVPVLQVVLAHRNAAGEIEFFSTVARDISERKALEAQLRQSQKMEAVGQLAGGVAHDFNNLLTAIAGYADLLLAHLPPGDPLRRDAEEIRRAVHRAADLTGQLLAISRRQVLVPRLLDLNEVVSGMAAMLRRLIGEAIELVLHLDPSLGPVKADPTHLTQVLLNLAVNARDAMPGGGTLAIETGNVLLDEAAARRRVGLRPGRYVRLTVRDTGCGMDAATQARIFEPFFTTKPPGRGTGLGLSTVYGIVRQSGGHIEVDSAPGAGATFTILLPRAEEQPAAAPAPAAAGPGPGEPSRAPARPPAEATVLVVEDEEGVRELVREVLVQQGYRVLLAPHGAAALAVAAGYRGAIDLLLTDLVMPHLSGRELARRLLAERPALRILFVSGYADTALPPAAGPDGRAAFLPKPFSPHRLVRAGRELLEAP
ncbi:MAG TPA: GAF domain-containing protein [Thermodesulfobacteriota bacterium]|nr:GAF domain-containing protein [Thermodesulfobacteriota bacterium]